MENYNYTVLSPGYSIGVQAYEQIAGVCSVYGSKVVVIGGHTAVSKVKELILQAVADSKLQITNFIWFGGESSYENVARLEAMEAVQQADMIFAVGGGKAMDTCKLLSHAVGKPLFTFPTIGSNCASFTSLAVVYAQNGVFKELAFSRIPPKHVFIYTPVIAAAPSEYLWAGMGDTIAKHYETSISVRGRELGHADLLGVTIGQLCCEPIMKYGAKAYADSKNKQTSREFEEVILAIIVSTGMVSNSVNPVFNGHIAHALFCTITVLPQIEEKHLHGEVVMYGVLLLLMVDKNMEDLKKAFDFCRQLGLPTKLTDIDVTLEEIDRVLPETEQSHEFDCTPYKVTRQMLHDGIVALEAYNQGK